MSKNICVFCDGTWNTPEQREGKLPSPTNVVKLFNLCTENDEQLKYYHPGVGASGSAVDKLLAGGIGIGLTRNILSAYEWLCRHYSTGDRLFLFGFSRGAYTVRSLAGFISRCGILELASVSERDAWAQVTHLYEKGYRKSKPSTRWPKSYRFTPGPLGDARIDIHMIGVWDTVGALGIPDDMVILDELLDDPSNYRFHNTELSSAVFHARHAVSIDEMRASFAPTLWDEPESELPGHTFKQLWFAGTHCDVGGGHAESGLSDCALSWMLDEAVVLGLLVNQSMADQIHPNPRGVLHDSLTGIWEYLRTQPRATPQFHSSIENTKLSSQVLDRHNSPPISQAPYWPTIVLAEGESKKIEVFALFHWNATGLYLEAGVSYRFSASGEWIDGGIVCGPEGAGESKFQFGKLAQLFGDVLGDGERIYSRITRKVNADWWGTKRVENADWFQLIGMIANQSNADGGGSPESGEIIKIGKQKIHVPKKSGYLYCFANDAWKFYGNNRGKVSVIVGRL